jgi:transketolase
MRLKEMYDNLVEKSSWVRMKVLESVEKANKGHLGGTFSCTDLLVALYYGGIINVDSKNFNHDSRDRFLLGKGHACLALFVILVDKGIMPKSMLDEYGKNSTIIGGQLDTRIPGSELNTGSLGHAIGIASGISLAANLNNKQYKSFAMVGDGECEEGSIWESAMLASKLKLKNIVAIVDRNRMGVTDVIEKDDGSGTLENKFQACGWKSITVDGHDFNSIMPAFLDLKNQEKPVVIIADTVKGKGVSFMESGIKWHHAVPTKEEFALARKELGF